MIRQITEIMTIHAIAVLLKQVMQGPRHSGASHDAICKRVFYFSWPFFRLNTAKELHQFRSQPDILNTTIGIMAQMSSRKPALITSLQE